MRLPTPPMNCSLLSLLVLATLPFLIPQAGCSEGKPTAKGDVAAAPAVKSVSDYFMVGLGTEKVRIQFAIHSAEQQRGLMHRRDLGPNDGMIFLYKAPQAMAFWMRNTPSALDIGYFDENGVLAEVYPLMPFDETAVRSRRPAKFALEMPQGWFQRHNVQPGSRLDLEAIAAAVKARGLNPVDYKLSAPATK